MKNWRAVSMIGLTRLIQLTAMVTVVACGEGKSHSPTTEGRADLPPEGALASIPLGDIAGASEDFVRTEINNPFGGSAAAVAEGEEYFHKMNCVSCHGYGARGGMGPNLRDSAWRYGGTPAEIYKSIAEGRPKGMPAWGLKLPPETIWKLTAYIESLGGATTTEDLRKDLEGWASESPKGLRSDDH